MFSRYLLCLLQLCSLSCWGSVCNSFVGTQISAFKTKWSLYCTVWKGYFQVSWTMAKCKFSVRCYVLRWRSRILLPAFVDATSQFPFFLHLGSFVSLTILNDLLKFWFGKHQGATNSENLFESECCSVMVVDTSMLLQVLWVAESSHASSSINQPAWTLLWKWCGGFWYGFQCLASILWSVMCYVKLCYFFDPRMASVSLLSYLRDWYFTIYM